MMMRKYGGLNDNDFMDVVYMYKKKYDYKNKCIIILEY